MEKEEIEGSNVGGRWEKYWEVGGVGGGELGMEILQPSYNLLQVFVNIRKGVMVTDFSHFQFISKRIYLQSDTKPFNSHHFNILNKVAPKVVSKSMHALVMYSPPRKSTYRNILEENFTFL